MKNIWKLNVVVKNLSGILSFFQTHSRGNFSAKKGTYRSYNIFNFKLIAKQSLKSRNKRFGYFVLHVNVP